MENIPACNQKLDESGSQIMQDISCIHVILREVLEQFSNKELMQVSLVNKEWNLEARSVLRDRGTLTASLCLNRSCQSLAYFASDVQNMRIVPFSGIHLLISHDHTRQSAPNARLLGFYYKIIRDRLPWNKFSVNFSGNWETCKKCPAALAIVKKILMDFCGVLEELSLTFEETHMTFLHKTLQGRSLSALTTLKIKTDCVEWSLTGFLKLLVDCSPNLQELHFDGCLFFVENFLEGSSAVLVPTSAFNPLYEHICESLMAALKATAIEIYESYPILEDHRLELLSEFIPMVLQASHTTITTLRMDLLFLVPLMCYDIRLESVTELEIGFPSDFIERIQPPILALVRSFDFTSVFPKLTQVQIVKNRNLPFSVDLISTFLDQANQVLSKPNRAINIQHLKLDDSITIWDSTFPFLTRMFPNIKALSLTTAHPPGFPYTLVWEHFANLEELSVKNTEWRAPIIANLDSVFCGIFPEEVAEVREMNDEYLKAVNIVPVMPSITCMRELRTFTVGCPVVSGEFPVDYDPARMFSKVTELIGFGRCPFLAVKLQTTRVTFQDVLNLKLSW